MPRKWFSETEESQGSQLNNVTRQSLAPSSFIHLICLAQSQNWHGGEGASFRGVHYRNLLPKLSEVRCPRSTNINWSRSDHGSGGNDSVQEEPKHQIWPPNRCSERRPCNCQNEITHLKEVFKMMHFQIFSVNFHTPTHKITKIWDWPWLRSTGCSFC